MKHRKLAIIVGGIFTTVPTVTSPTSSSVSYNSAVVGGNITSNGGSPITSRGIVWGTSPSPRGNVTPEGGTSTGVFTFTVSGFPTGTLIYFAAYAANSIGTGYSADGTFTTLAGTIPTVTSPTATAITNTTATLGAKVTNTGGALLTDEGIYWGYFPAPRVNKVSAGSTSGGIFTVPVTGLPTGTIIYYCGYATNYLGTGYSIDGTFTTTGPTPNPLITFTYQNNGPLPSPIPYSTTVATQAGLPVLVGEPSDHVTIRVYNNYNAIKGVPDIYNIQFQTFDNILLSTQSTQPVTQNWLHMTQTGFGSNSTSPALYTAYYEQTDTALGGSSSAYIPSWGSDGSSTAIIKAEDSCGMIEFDTYVAIPTNASVNNTTYNFVLGIVYDWNPL